MSTTNLDTGSKDDLGNNIERFFDNGDYESKLFSSRDIQEFCLDKQRVREAMEESKVVVHDEDGNGEGYYFDEDKFIKKLKELGL